MKGVKRRRHGASGAAPVIKHRVVIAEIAFKANNRNKERNAFLSFVIKGRLLLGWQQSIMAIVTSYCEAEEVDGGLPILLRRE